MLPAPDALHLPGAELFYYGAFIAPAESAQLLSALIRDTAWRQDSLVFGGRKVLVPRLQAWYGERRYGYSGLRLDPLPWTPVLADLRARIASVTRLAFNSVLLNYYRDGNDSVAWHSDDERELGPDPHIASLSLGAARRFEFRHRTQKNLKQSIVLDDGSLLLMGTGMQKNWVHQLPKDKRCAGPRLNLTFRFIH